MFNSWRAEAFFELIFSFNIFVLEDVNSRLYTTLLRFFVYSRFNRKTIGRLVHSTDYQFRVVFDFLPFLHLKSFLNKGFYAIQITEETIELTEGVARGQLHVSFQGNLNRTETDYYYRLLLDKNAVANESFLFAEYHWLAHCHSYHSRTHREAHKLETPF